MLYNNIVKKYSTKRLINIRKLYNLKMCYKKKLNFINLKLNISNSMSNRLAVGSKFKGSYSMFRKFYIIYLRKNFLFKKYKNNTHYKSNINGYFSSAYSQYIALNDLNRVLLWRALQIQPLFKILTRYNKLKKKKYFYTHDIFFMREEKRILVTWVWLKNFIKTLACKDFYYQLFLGLENFLNSYDDKHVVSNIKLQVYKIQLLRTL